MYNASHITNRLAVALGLAIVLSGCASTAPVSQSLAAAIPSTNGAGLAGALGLSPPKKKGSIWQVVVSPNDAPDSAGLYDDQLNGVSGSSSSDVWAVGRFCCTPHGTQEYYSSLIEHWDGNAWTIVSGAPTEPADVQLFAVAAIAPDDAWAFGHGGYPNSEPLIEHWNGSAWSVVSGPTIYGRGELVAVTAISSNNIWAAGDGNFQPLVEHWNGTQWSVVANVTEKGGAAYFNGIAAANSNDIMAVGGYSHPNAHILAAHWNGTAWTDVTPSKDFFVSRFFAVTSDASGSYWASGYEDPNKQTAVPQTLIEHWNGSTFARVPTPNYEPKGSVFTNWLVGIAAESPTDIWAVGLWTWYPGDGTPRSLFEHWNGKKWTIKPGPTSLESSNNYATNNLLSITKVNASTLWSVGTQDVPPNCCSQTLTVQTTHG